MAENAFRDSETPSDRLTPPERRSYEGIPTASECDAVFTRLKVPGRVVAHSIVTAEIARALAVHLNLVGSALNIPLIVAAGRLHDIARGQPNHAAAGAEMLSDMGYPRVGDVTAKHTDIRSGGPAVDEADLIYYADKRVEEDRVVSLEERFEKSRGRYADRPDILRKISGRFENAKDIAARIEGIIHGSVDDLVHRYERSARAAANFGRKTICLIRHGAVQSSQDPKRFIGQLDLPLTEKGLRQAEGLAEGLKQLPVTAVHCSDLRRSIATAELIAEERGVSCIPMPELREISLGQWEGLSFDEVRKSRPEKFAARGSDIVRYRPTGGESFLDCAFRVLPAFNEILNSAPDNILIVGHAGVNRIILSQALGRPLKDLFDIDQEYGCVNLLVRKYPALEVKLLNGSVSDLNRPARS